ncbi:carbonic anhydrase [Iningainema tapete]|uniref:carbonic anhydrase n=1 Tax=Iningainema tapete BLCC-T55 TaxID=2748662 RepID=A0A8J6XJ10_9CYAN|nr:carbonic anhydrase [Iningainema tapete]MBD2776889.1 carbonic anhydrase [Iningainema tapete BLCC-T55]
MSRINGFVGRRHFLVGSGIVAAAGISSLIWGVQEVTTPQHALADADKVNPSPVTPDEALQRLLDGNNRFLRQQRKYPDQSLERVRLIAKAQYPFASILGCADSRVPAEIVFDQGLGDLFVVRVAGNVASDSAIGSLEYSTAVLGAGLIVVLGHKRCGAVTAALEEKPVTGRVGLIIESIKPGIEQVKLSTGDVSEEAVVANILYQTEKLQERSTILGKLMAQSKLKIVGALYNLDTGKVSIVT